METVHVAATALSLVVNGMPISATYLQSTQDPCEMTGFVAGEWRKKGSKVAQSKTGPWCTVGMVKDGAWIAEQWRFVAKNSATPALARSHPLRSEGWRIRIPLEGMVGRSGRPKHPWQLDVLDQSLGARIQFRSLSEFDLRIAQLTKDNPVALSSSIDGGLMVKGLDHTGRGYAVAIQRGVAQ